MMCKSLPWRAVFIAQVSTVFFVSCDTDKSAELELIDNPGWHIGIYMAADNNLDGAASRDLLEMVAANRNGAANVTVFLDRAEPDAYQPRTVPGVPQTGEAHILRMKGRGFEVVEELSEIDSTDPQYVAKFIQRIAQEPEERKALIFWNHGAPDRYGSDETDGARSIRLSELASAFEHPTLDEPYHFEVLGFDTCLMGSLGALETFAPLSDVYIASAELEPGDGWDYRGLLEGLQDPQATAESFGEITVSAFQRFYSNNPGRTSGLGVTLAAFSTDLAAVDQSLIDWALAAENRDDRALNEATALFSGITRAVGGATPYGAKGEGSAASYDLGDTLNLLVNDVQDSQVKKTSAALLSALQATRIAFATTRSESKALGVSTRNTASDSGASAFFSNALGQQAAGRLQLVSDDSAPATVLLQWDSRADNPGIDFGIVKFAASDDALITAARISLVGTVKDDASFIFSSFEVAGSKGQTELTEQLYGLPLGGISFAPPEAVVEAQDIAALILTEQQLSLLVSVEVAGETHRGQILLKILP